MKKLFFAMMALVALFMVSIVKADEKIDIKAEYEYEQKVCMEALVNAWLAQKSDKEMVVLLGNLVRANSRYRMTADIDNSVAGSMLRATEAGKTAKEKLSLAICEYYRSKGIILDTRNNFNRGSFMVRQ